VLKRSAGNEACKGLILLALPVSLPPVSILLADDVKNVALLEANAQLPARDIWVVLGVVVKVSFHVQLQTPNKSLCFAWEIYLTYS